jgi:hypothetical protein
MLTEEHKDQSPSQMASLRQRPASLVQGKGGLLLLALLSPAGTSLLSSLLNVLNQK